MLQAIRDRAQGIFAWILLIAIGVPFALWGIQNYIDTGKEKPAAVVGDREILDRDVSRAYEQNLASLVGVADYDDKQLRKAALERLIRDELIIQSAEQKSLAVGDASIRGFIRSLPYFQTEGHFDKEKYKIMLAAQNLNSSGLAAQIRRALLMEQFQKSITVSAFVTEGDVEVLLRLKNQERDIEYVKLPLKPSAKIFAEAEIEKYYREHLPDFRNPEKVSVEYILLDLESLAKDTKISNNELRNIYEEQKANLDTDERRKVSHILVPTQSQDREAGKAALDKINSIRERLVRGEDFARIAAEVSGDPISAKKGGNLGFLDRSGMEENFVKVAYALNLGEISKPVKTSFGYHIITVTEIIPARQKSFEEVEAELRRTAQHNAAEARFYELGQILTEQSYEHPDSLEPAAKQSNLEVRYSGLFARDGGEDIAADPAIRSAAFSEEVLNGRNSDPIELNNEKAVVLRVKEHQAASDRPLSEVREIIVKRLRDIEASKKVVGQVKELKKQIQVDGHSFTEAAQARELDVIRVSDLHRDNKNLPQSLLIAVFKAPRPQGNSPGTVGNVELKNGEQVVFSVLAVKDEASSGNPNEQITARDFLSKNGGQREFAAFIARLRETAKVQVKPES